MAAFTDLGDDYFFGGAPMGDRITTVDELYALANTTTVAQDIYNALELMESRARVCDVSPITFVPLIVSALKKFFPTATTLLEVGAGKGLIARLVSLELPDLKVIATDIEIKAPTCAVEKKDAVTAVTEHKGGVLLIVWPTPAPWTHEALKAADVEGLIYIGCEDAGCDTASDMFYDMLASDWKCKIQVNPRTQWQEYENPPVLCVFKRRADSGSIGQ